jgi:hypothetical protein
MTLFRARRSAEAFADTVDGRADGRHAHDREVSSLLEVVNVLRNHDPATPRDEFAADLRSRLLLEADRVLTPDAATLRLPSRPRGVRERRLLAAASALVLVGGTSTMAAASQDSLPGHALYPVKRGIERVEAELSISAAGKGRDLLHQATSRLSEVQGLLASDSTLATARVPETLDDFTATAAHGSELLFESFEETRDPDAVAEVREFAANGVETLGRIAVVAPADTQDELTEAALTLQEIDDRATQLCSTCEGLPPVQVPGLLLANAEVDRALDRATATGDDLGNSHPVVVNPSLSEALREATEQEIEDVTSGVAGAADTTADPGEEDAPTVPKPLPSPTVDTDELPNVLPGADKNTSSGSDDTGLPETTDGLADTVETLLPDLTEDDGGLLP